MLNTPPSKANHQTKYLMANNLNHGETSLFSATPKDEVIKTHKEYKPTTMFNSNIKFGLSQAKSNMLL